MAVHALKTMQEVFLTEILPNLTKPNLTQPLPSLTKG